MPGAGRFTVGVVGRVVPPGRGDRPPPGNDVVGRLIPGVGRFTCGEIGRVTLGLVTEVVGRVTDGAGRAIGRFPLPGVGRGVDTAGRFIIAGRAGPTLGRF